MNRNPPTAHLPKQKARWNHQPSKAIRVPEVFLGEIERYTIALDSGEGNGNGTRDVGLLSLKSVSQWLGTLEVEPLLQLKSKIEIALIEAKERQSDKRLEQAIAYLASRCDGAISEDGKGFNGSDARFGHWLASQIKQNTPLLKSHAEPALKMLRKYAKQLERGGLSLPEWEAIAHQYPASHAPQQQEELAEYRVELKGSKIAVYAPYDSMGQFQRQAKAIEGYHFYSKKEGGDNGWYYPLSKAEEVLLNFNSEGGYEVDPELEGVLALLESQRAEEAARLEAEAFSASGEIIRLVQAADLDAPLANGWHLREYQKRGVEWLLAHRGGGIYRGGILADHMGLGKSLVALVAARAMQRKYDCPVFVVAPVSLLENWQREAERAQVRIECFSWAKQPKPLDTQKYVLICDEAHFAQNVDSQRTKKMLELAQHENCLASWLLTGTPIKNGRPINLYPLLLAVNHPLAANKWDYQKYYCNAHHKTFGTRTVWDVTGAAHLDELSKKTEDAILRRTKQECLTELPAKTRLFKQVELEAQAVKAYDGEIQKLVKSYRDRIKAGEVDPDAEALVTLNYLRKVGSQFKVEAAVSLAEELLEQGQQVVLFTEYLESAKSIYQALGGELLTGESKVEERQGMVDRFQAGESKVFVGTIKAGGVGITLTAASHVILVDRAWTSAECDQAEDRIHRLGQRNVTFSFWIQLGEIDKAIDSLIERKAERIELILRGKRKTLKGLQNPKDLAKELLEYL